MATNRADTLDPALLRPGRLDRKIEFPNPDRRQKRMVFTACVAKMNLSEEVSFQSNAIIHNHSLFSNTVRLCSPHSMSDLALSALVLCIYAVQVSL
jgi:ATP-dependent 26S proteasome regulatory subunit